MKKYSLPVVILETRSPVGSSQKRLNCTSQIYKHIAHKEKPVKKGRAFSNKKCARQICIKSKHNPKKGRKVSIFLYTLWPREHKTYIKITYRVLSLKIWYYHNIEPQTRVLETNMANNWQSWCIIFGWDRINFLLFL